MPLGTAVTNAQFLDCDFFLPSLGCLVPGHLLSCQECLMVGPSLPKVQMQNDGHVSNRGAPLIAPNLSVMDITYPKNLYIYCTTKSWDETAQLEHEPDKGS